VIKDQQLHPGKYQSPMNSIARVYDGKSVAGRVAANAEEMRGAGEIAGRYELGSHPVFPSRPGFREPARCKCRDPSIPAETDGGEI
jgi:hypothetical protein